MLFKVFRDGGFPCFSYCHSIFFLIVDICGLFLIEQDLGRLLNKGSNYVV